MMKKIAASLMTTLTLLIPGCAQKEQAIPEVIRPVVTMTAVAPEAGRQRTFSGMAKASVETYLSFRISGEIRELPIKSGMTVKTGGLIAQLDTTDCELQVKQNEAQVAQAEAQLEQAKSEYERIRQLYESQSVSKSVLDGQQASFKSSQASRDAAQKGLELARQQLDYCTLRAPVEGLIDSVPFEAHQTISAGQTIAVMTSGDELEVDLGIPEALISKVHVGDSATVTFDAVAGEVFEAIVSEVSVRPGDSGAYPVNLKLLKPDSRIRPGMVAEATFSFESAGAAGVMVIPPAAVVPTPQGERFIWIVNPATETVTQRTVKVGALTSAGLEILEGLKPGEQLVIRGVHRLEDGMKVKLLTQDPSAS
ncbi:MAG: efflux RND transporter periplasmic adaptor subunit [Lentisphaerota bacterium]